MKIEYLKILVIAVFMFIFTTNCIDNPHFYKATHFWEEPRFEETDLNSFQFWFGGGKTTHGYNGCKHKVNILQIYGPENLHALAKGVPQATLDKLPKTIITNVSNAKSLNSDFGKLEFDGLFKMLELDLDFKKNFYYGFFGELHMPFRMLEIEDIYFQDFSNAFNAGLDINFNKWMRFMACFKNNMAKYNIDIGKFKSTGIGDTSLLIGYTKNYEDTDYIDFIDFTIKTGLTLPTGKTASLKNPFALPLGYNGHLGFNGYLNVSVGLYEWLTLDGFTSAIVFADKTKNIRIKTDYEQNGFLKLAQTCARVSKGTIFSIGAYLKADHIVRGLSLLMAYRFDKEFRTKLHFDSSNTFDLNIANSDKQLLGWYMNTLNLIAEYDFATYENPNRPSIEIFCDFPINGKRIFKTKIFGLGFNIDYCW